LFLIDFFETILSSPIRRNSSLVSLCKKITNLIRAYPRSPAPDIASPATCYNLIMPSPITRLLSSRPLHFILAAGLILLAAGGMFLLRDDLSVSTVALLFLLPVLTSTTIWGLGPGVLSAFIAFLAYNYFFIPPYYTFTVHRTQDLVALLIFLVVWY
jgi:hypothetical protein